MHSIFSWETAWHTATKISIWYLSISLPINLIIYPLDLLTPSFLLTSCSASGCKFFHSAITSLSKKMWDLCCAIRKVSYGWTVSKARFLLPVDFVEQRLYALKSSILLCIILDNSSAVTLFKSFISSLDSYFCNASICKPEVMKASSKFYPQVSIAACHGC